jgi:hypothetical protein
MACATLLLAGLTPTFAADKGANGTWTWTTPARGGGEERTTTLKLTAEGEKLTGKVSTPGREGRVTEVDITDGKLKGDEVSFTVVRDTQNGKMTQKFVGKLAGDTIKGKIETERDGNSRSRDWEAKRKTEAKS